MFNLLRKLTRQIINEQSNSIKEEGFVHNLSVGATLAASTLASQDVQAQKIVDVNKIENDAHSFTSDKTVEKVFNLFFFEFLKNKINFNAIDTTSDYIRELSNLKDSDLIGTIDFFKSKNYGQPNDTIVKLQKIIKVKLGIAEYENVNGKIFPFVDGIFGMATAKAFVKLEIKRLQEMKSGEKFRFSNPDKTKKYRSDIEMKDSNKKSKENSGLGTQSYEE